jgi:hypothetical protein
MNFFNFSWKPSFFPKYAPLNITNPNRTKTLKTGCLDKNFSTDVAQLKKSDETTKQELLQFQKKYKMELTPTTINNL